VVAVSLAAAEEFKKRYKTLDPIAKACSEPPNLTLTPQISVLALSAASAPQATVTTATSEPS
jgi:hypothetical protein